MTDADFCRSLLHAIAAANRRPMIGLLVRPGVSDLNKAVKPLRTGYPIATTEGGGGDAANRLS